VALCDLVELAGRAARRLDLSCGQHDLYVGGQKSGPFQRLRGLAHGATDCGGGSVAVALRQPQQG
jgi:hypothetical protein